MVRDNGHSTHVDCIVKIGFILINFVNKLVGIEYFHIQHMNFYISNKWEHGLHFFVKITDRYHYCQYIVKSLRK